MAPEDFTFPKVNNKPNPTLTISPSLWRVSSVIYPDYNTEDEDIELNTNPETESEARKEITGGQDKDEEEEKMDSLWEEFNEELQRVCSYPKKDRLAESSGKSCDLKLVPQVSEKQRVFVVVKALKKVLLRYKSLTTRKKKDENI